MGKIRVQDLARMMGVENQDLMFKLRSIGVRIEGDEALIDTDIIQAILQGKKLPQPREVILRDDAAAQTTPGKAPSNQPPVRRTSGYRPHRRAMIQRVEPRIRELEPRKPSAAEETAAGAEAAEAVTGTTPEVAPPTEPASAPQGAPAAETAAPPVEAVEEKVAEEQEPRPAAEPPAKTAAKAEEKAVGATEPAVKAEKAAKTKVEAKAVAKAKAKPKAEEPVAAKPKAVRPASSKARAKVVAPPPVADRRIEVKKTPAARGRREAPMGTSAPRGRPANLRRSGRPGRPMPRDDRRPLRAPAASVEAVKPKASSERGRRRAQRKQDEPERKSGEIQFKSERPTDPVTIAEGMTVREFAEKLDVKAKDLIKILVTNGIMANINHVLDTETAMSLAEQLGIEVMEVTFEKEVQLRHESTFEGTNVEKTPRAPVVTVMGHVDHGKTTLLDRIRKTNVAEGEAGGITQHIGAYHVDTGDRQIVFLDTPGHEAFTMMRARGARVTDIVVLVVAADDSVMPQTIEAIDHAKAAGVPIVVAINKTDKANANLDRVRKELADHGLVVEDWGGEVVSVPMSALKGEGVDALLEMILLTADILELKAAPELPASGTVLEARKEIGRGIIATALVQNGTLRTGDVFVAGSTWGRVRLMTDERGNRLPEAGPATPVEITGFTEVPGAGDLLQVMDAESKARSIAELRRQEERTRELRPNPGKMSLEQLFDQMKGDEAKELTVVVKADVDGSVEVLRDALIKLSTEKVRVNIIHAAVGAITTNDVILASASNAVIVGFNVRPEKNAVAMAEKEGIDIRLHTVIYELSDELTRAMTGLLEPVFREVRTGTAEIRDTFRVPKVGVVAGCHIVEGFIPRSASVRLLRDNVVVYEGKIASLRRFKEDVAEVRSGFDCGIGLERFQDVKPGDSIEAFTREEVTPTL